MNSLKLILRRWRSRPTFFCLGVLGLGVSFSVLILVLSYIQFELNFDKYIPKNENIYLVSREKKMNTYLDHSNLGKTLEHEVPGIKASATLWMDQKGYYADNTEIFNERYLSVSQDFFKVFNWPLKGGNYPVETDKNDIFISEDAAIRHFGKTDVVGMQLKSKDALNNEDIYTVKGIFKNLPKNSSIKADVIISVDKTTPDFNGTETEYRTSYNWLLIDNNTGLNQIEKRLNSYGDKISKQEKQKFKLVNLSDLHFSDDKSLQKDFNTTSPKILYLLIVISLFILIIASINYINLSIAKSSSQIKEFGVRKTFGASKLSLIKQSFFETSIHLFVSMLIAIFIAVLTFPYFTKYLKIEINIEHLFDVKSIVVLIGISIIIVILCGIFPVLQLLNKNAEQLLRRNNFNLDINFNIKNALIIVQFCISIFLIIFSIGIHNQVKLLTNRPLGFDKEQLLILPNVQLRERYQSFKNELKNIPGIISVAGSSMGIGLTEDKNKIDSITTSQTIIADFDFIQTLGIKLLEGKNFDANSQHHRVYNMEYMLYDPEHEDEFIRKARARPIIVSKNLIDHYNIKDPIGKIHINSNGNPVGTIIGVVDDFEFGSQRDKNSIKVIFGDYSFYFGGYVILKIANNQISNTLSKVEKVWKQKISEKQFEYSFVDERIDNLYKEELGLSWLITVLTLISIILSIVGAISLLAITIQQKTKEIGIRKVLGASILRIFRLLLLNSLKPIFIALIIAIPISWWAMNLWLNNFEYKVSLNFTIFLISGSFIILLTTLSMFIQVLKAARENPINSLRDE